MPFRSVRAALVGVALVLGLAPAAAAAAAPAPWLQNGYDGAASNANLRESTLTSGTVAGAVPLRTFRSAGQSCFGGPGRVAPPLLSDDHVYAFDGKSLDSFDAATGGRNWATPLPDAQYESPKVLAVSHGVVVVGSNDCGTNDPVGQVAAYRTTDGSLAWTLHLPYEDGFSSAHVSGKYLAVATNEFEAGEYEISVFRIQDGGLVWTRSTFSDDGDGDGVINTASVIVDGKVFSPVLRPDGTSALTAYDLATGHEVWSGDAADTVERGDTDGAGDSHLYVTAGGIVYDVDPASGARRFALAGAGRTYAVDAARVYASCGDGTQVCAFDRQTGVPLYSYAVDGVPSAVVVAADVLYVDRGRAQRRAAAVVLDAASGRVLRGLPGTPTAVGQGRIAVLQKNGGLALYGLPGS